MTDMPTTPPLPVPAAPPIKARLDADGRLAEDIDCRKCGYNLRGLSPDGRCPECGTATGRSLDGDFLRFSDPDWVGVLASGMNWIYTAIAIGLFGGLCIGILTSVTGMVEVYWTLPLAIGVSVAALVGFWKVTTPDPAGLEAPSGQTVRRLARITQIAGLAMIPAVTLLETVSQMLAFITSILCGGVCIVAVFAIFVYASRLALRIPEDKLAKSCRTVMWGFAIAMCLGISTGVVTTSTPPSTAATAPPGVPLLGGTVVAIASCFVPLLLLFVFLWSLRMLDRFLKAFKQAAQQARATWAEEALPTPR